jgi:hypothetical protein
MKTPPTRRLVLDVLKPHEPPMTEFAAEVASLKGVEGVNATLVETDEEVQNIKLTVEGEDVDRGDVDSVVSRLGGSVHSVDQVVVGERLVEDTPTPQDR